MELQDFVANSIISNNYGNITLLLIINIAITFVAYEFFPLISRFWTKDVYDKSSAIKASAINSLCVFILFTLYNMIILGKLQFVSITPAIIYGFISYFILMSNHSTNTKENDK